MNDVSQSQLGKKIDEFLTTVEFATNKKIREIKVSKGGNLTNLTAIIINDEQYLQEDPRFF